MGYSSQVLPWAALLVTQATDLCNGITQGQEARKESGCLMDSGYRTAPLNILSSFPQVSTWEFVTELIPCVLDRSAEAGQTARPQCLSSIKTLWIYDRLSGL